jgi:hypothetical protein
MKRLLILCFIALITIENAQSQVGDWQSRIGIEAGFKLTKKLSLELGVQNRSNLNKRSNLSNNFSIQVNYNFFKNWKLAGSYRNVIQPNEFAYLDGNNWSFRNRGQLALHYDPSKLLNVHEALELDIRSMIQYEQFQYKRNQWYWRNRITLEPKLKSKFIRPYLSFEMLYRFNQYSYFMDNTLVTQGLMNELRYIGGVKFNLKNKNTINLGLMFRDYRTKKLSNPILLLTYSHDFGRIFKSK